MREVWKWPVELGSPRRILCGPIKKPIRVAYQGGQIHTWFEHDLNGLQDSYELRIFGTGSDIPDGYIHAGSTESSGGYIWHVYYKRIKEND